MLRKTKVATSINEAPSAITKKIEFSSARVSNDTRRKRLIGLIVCIVFGLIVGSLMSVEFIDVVFSSDSSENLLQGATFDQHTESEYNITLPSNDKLGDRENTYHSQEDNEKNENHLVATIPNLPLKGLRHKLESIIGPEYMTFKKMEIQRSTLLQNALRHLNFKYIWDLRLINGSFKHLTNMVTKKQSGVMSFISHLLLRTIKALFQ